MIKRLFIFSALFLLLSITSLADVAFPTVTTVYFKNYNQPYTEQIDYTITCYGFHYADDWWENGDDPAPDDYDPLNPEEVYSYEFSCTEYGCATDESYYLNYREVDYCTLEAQTQGITFRIPEFAESPVPENCTGDFERTCEISWEIGDLIQPETEALAENYSHCKSLGGEPYRALNELFGSVQTFCEFDQIGTCTQTELSDAKCFIEQDVFQDVPDTHDNLEAIMYVKNNNFVQGFGDGTFKPDDPINRAEFIKIVILSKYPQSAVDSCVPQKEFIDVEDDAWSKDYICLAVNMGIVNGYADNTFKAFDFINFAESSKVITRTLLDLDVVEPVPWYTPYVMDLQNRQAVPLSIQHLNKMITRADMAEMIFRVKNGITNKPAVNTLLE